ncbi:hypothetical protein SAMN05421756_10645 [Microlunatus flavus]|uniref:Uncharacterized protein n=1 Tax=Microlunatus flavus TaxID=1036181 RepID=A0A1H9J0K2_9ACTN|nr:hypothetical protein SAMN05421756_10645 [Microlunatus flavus]
MARLDGFMVRVAGVGATVALCLRDVDGLVELTGPAPW